MSGLSVTLINTSQPMMLEKNLDRKGIYHFDVVDYVVFSSLLIISALTGVYFGCRGKYCASTNKPTLREYLTGNRNLKPFPVALSLIGSYISGVTVLGTPADIYLFGTQYWLILIPVWVGGLLIAYVYLPVFFRLQVNSAYEYLELRFNSIVRTMVSIFFIVDALMYLPVVLYVPSLAFNQVSGINIHLVGTIVAVVCIFYTYLGGLRAVVWTDAWQVITMFISVLVVVVLGTVVVGGPSVVINQTNKGGRFIFFDTNPSMYERYSIFSVVIGGLGYWICVNSANQTMVQRYLSVPTERQSKISVLIFTVGTSIFIWMCCYMGILIYAAYFECDPISLGRIKADDQILPLYIMETVGHLRGIPGLFVAGIFGASLSSLSVNLNAMAQVFLEDFLKGFMKMSISEKVATVVVKGVVLGLGLIAVGFMYVVEHMGGILTVAFSLTSVASSTACGIFTLGMVIPWANSRGAVVGAIFGTIMSGLISFGGQFAAATKMIISHRLPVFANDSCFERYGINNKTVLYPDESNIFPLFRLSYLWITPVSFMTVLVVGTVTSFLTEKTDLTTLDPDLISPVFQWILLAEARRNAGSSKRRARDKHIDEKETMLQQSPIIEEIIHSKAVHCSTIEV